MHKVFFVTKLFLQHHLIVPELSVSCGVSESPVFAVSSTSGSLPFDVWDPEDFILKLPHLALSDNLCEGNATCLDLRIFLWKNHL